MDELRVTRPAVGAEELAEIEKVLASGYLTQGPAVAEFESTVASYVGVKHAFAMSSATTAMHLALVALGVGPGDDVVVPAFTFPATANVVVQAGARPVLADIHPATFAVTPETVEAALTPKTRAIIPVDPFGYPADMQGIVDLVHGRDIRIVEDAACAIGASRKGTMCGAFPDVGCYSFHPRKVITTGEGGMITTDDDAIADRISLLRSHGGKRDGDRQRFEAAGFNYRLSDVQGAMGNAQMSKLPGLLARRRTLAGILTRLLTELPGVRPPATEPGADPTYQSYVVLLDADYDRDGVIRAMQERGVQTVIGTYGLHLEPYFQRTLGVTEASFPTATHVTRQSLTLPLFPDMDDADTDRIVTELASALSVSTRAG